MWIGPLSSTSTSGPARPRDGPALCGDTNPRQCEAHSTARTSAQTPGSPRGDDCGGDRHHDGAPLWSGAPPGGDGPWHGERREHRLAAGQPTALCDRREQERAEDVGRPAGRSAGLAAGARRRRSQGLRRPGRERDVPFGAFGRATAEGTGDARALLRAHRDRPGEPATTHRAGAKADRPRRRRASDRTPARPQLTRRRAARAIRLVDDPISPAGLRLEWSRRAEWDDWSRHCEGCYVLRTNLRDWSSEALWRTYIQLSEAEAAFRIHKSELSIRPIWHQREDRALAGAPWSPPA